MHRVHLPDASPPVATLSADEAHHVVHVLRLKAGDVVVAFDGRGHEWDARIATVTRAAVTLALGAARMAVSEPAIHVTLAIGRLKGEQMNDVVRDATMLGVTSIVPLVCAHVAVPKAARQPRGAERWARVAVASAKQCHRAVVPEILAPQSFDAVVRGWATGPLLMCVEPALAGGHDVPAAPAEKAALLLVGPEGGWAPEEVAEVRRRNGVLIALGPRTLRAEAAPSVALSVLWARWGWT